MFSLCRIPFNFLSFFELENNKNKDHVDFYLIANAASICTQNLFSIREKNIDILKHLHIGERERERDPRRHSLRFVVKWKLLIKYKHRAYFIPLFLRKLYICLNLLGILESKFDLQVSFLKIFILSSNFRWYPFNFRHSPHPEIQFRLNYIIFSWLDLALTFWSTEKQLENHNYEKLLYYSFEHDFCSQPRNL